MNVGRIRLFRLTLIELIVIVGSLAMILAISEDWILGIRRSWVADQILESYRKSAALGEVVQPSTNLHSLSCYSMCFYSLPQSISVKTADGQTLHYFAERRTNSAGWTFKFFGGRDTNGIWFTNVPICIESK